MTINIKSVGGCDLHLFASIPIQPAAPFTVPVTARKCRMTTTVKLNAAMRRLQARVIVETRGPRPCATHGYTLRLHPDAYWAAQAAQEASN